MTGTFITKKGMILIAKLLASNQELVFTRAAVGTGSAPQGWDPAGMTGLNQYKMNGKISSCHSEGEEATVVFQINSTDVESGFVITEAGLFAEDPDEGEILYAYLDLTDDPQYVYAKNSVVQKFAEIEFKTIVGAIENITVITSPDALVTKEVFEKEIDTLSNPEFDDSGTTAGITGFPAFLQKVKSKMNIFEFYRNFKAGMQYVLHTGQIVNNCTSESENLPLAAAQGKVLWDRQTQLISDLGNGTFKFITLYDENVINNPVQTIKNQWPIISDGTYVANITHGSKYCAILYRIDNGENGAAIIFGYPLRNVKYMHINEGVWESEKTLVTNSDLATTTIDITNKLASQHIDSSTYESYSILVKSGNVVTLMVSAQVKDLTGLDTILPVGAIPTSHRTKIAFTFSVHGRGQAQWLSAMNYPVSLRVMEDGSVTLATGTDHGNVVFINATCTYVV